MKTFTLTCAMLLLFSFGLFAQFGLNIRTGGAVTVFGSLSITDGLFICGSNVTDTRDGKTYPTVSIGTQCWFAKNLNVGTKVFGSSNQLNNSIIEKYCYNDDDANCAVYGGLYQWDEAMQYSTTAGAQGLCPDGWHLPTDLEWTTLLTFLGGESIAGGKMKEAGFAHWYTPNTGATNSTGFTGLPSGLRIMDGTFSSITGYIGMWSSTLDGPNVPWYRYLGYAHEGAFLGSSNKAFGFSLRCLHN